MMACTSPIMQRHQAVRSFAFWLKHYVRAKSDDPIQMEVNKLSDVSGNLNDAMQLASEIISHHSDHFNIPHREGQVTREGIFHILQNQWDLFHQSATTDHQLMLEQGVHLVVVRFENGNPAAHPLRNANHRSETKRRNVESSVYPTVSHSHPLSPLASGIAIGAP